MKFDTLHISKNLIPTKNDKRQETVNNRSMNNGDNYFMIRPCILICILIITLQTTLICFLIVFPYDNTSEIKSISDDTDYITASYISSNSSLLDYSSSSISSDYYEGSADETDLNPKFYLVNLTNIEYFQDNMNEIVEDYEYIRISSEIISLRILNTVDITHNVKIEAEHEVKIECPEFLISIFNIKEASTVEITKFKMEGCGALNIPIAIVTEQSYLTMNYLDLINLKSNVNLFEVYDSTLKLINTEIEKCMTPETMINSDKSSVIFSSITRIRLNENGIINARDSSILLEDSVLSTNNVNEKILISTLNTDVNIFNSDFISNEGSNSGIILNSQYGHLNIVNSVFSDNHSGKDCACINISDQSNLNMTDLTVKDNFSKTNGGFGCLSNSDTIITNSYFKNNNVEENSSVLSIIKSQVYIESSSFIENISKAGSGALNFGDSNYNIKNSIFNGNSASSGSCVQQNGNSVGEILSSTFNDNDGYYGSSISISGGEIQLNKSTFTNNKSQKYAGGIYSESGSNIKISECEFLENSSKEAGAIFATHSDIIIQNSHFEKCSASDVAGAVQIDNSKFEITDCYFLKNFASLGEGGALLIENNLDSANYIKRCVFNDNEASYGGSIFHSDAETIIENSNFERNSALLSRGGAIYAITSTMKVLDCRFTESYAILESGAIFASKTDIIIENSNFNSNQVLLSGGAISTDVSNIYIKSSNFTNNQGSVGGAAYFRQSMIDISDSLFEYNVASDSGGALAHINTDTVKGHIENCIFNENEAITGPALSISNADPLEVISSNFTQNKATEFGCIDLTENTTSNFTSCNFVHNTVASKGAVFSVENYVNISLLYCQIDNNAAEKGGIFYMTGKNCTFEAEYCVMINNKAIYGSLGYLDGDGTHIVMISDTLSDNNISENDIYEIDGIYVNNGTDERILVSTMTFDEVEDIIRVF